MSLKDQIREASAGLVKRETVTLPECGIVVQVRGLMSGEVNRSGESKRAADVQVALSSEDPATGKRIWDAGDLMDLEEIAGLHSVDKALIIQTSNRLSGIDRLGKLFTPPTENGSSSSLPSSVDPSGS